MPDRARLVAIADIEAARERLRGVLRPTPAYSADALSRALGRTVILKPEHLQRAGSFKIRGAYNRIVQLAPGLDVVAASAGNHAQGVALAAQLTGRKATIFMPAAASLPKLQATRDYGADTVLGGATIDDCLPDALAFAERTGAVFVPPFDDPDVIAGQGTLGFELVEEVRALNVSAPVTVLVPTGGGGLLAGTALAFSVMQPDARVIGVEAAGAASLRQSLDAGRLVTLKSVSTMADGIALKAPGVLPFDMVRAYVDDVLTVTEEDISRAVLMLVERAKAVVEPSGAVGIAALLADKVSGDGPVVAVLSGGNVDPLLLTNLLSHGLGAAGRYLRLKIVFADRPGSLAALTAELARLGLNVLDVEHHREGTRNLLDEVEVDLTVETRGQAHSTEAVHALAERGFRVERV